MGRIYGILNAPAAIRRILAAREIIGDRTPLRRDCGRLCGGACCKGDETGENGMLLYPFEERLYKRPLEGFPFRLIPDDTLYKGGFRLVCEGACKRDARPLACRLFPLRLSVRTESVTAEPDPRAYAVCPLCEHGLRAFDPEFVGAAERAGGELMKNAYLLEALLNDQKQLDDLRRPFFG